MSGDDNQMLRPEGRDALYNEREERIETLERVYDELADDEVVQMFSREEVKIRQQRLQKHFDEFERAHLALRRTCLVSTNGIYVQMEHRFIQIMSKLEARIQESVCSDQRNNLLSSTPNEIAPSVITVVTPRTPQVGTFNGNPADWPAFRDLFLAEVHSKDFDAVTKLIYLKQACTEGAALTLGPWKPTAGNYKPAWDILMQAYNDDYHVIHSILGQMYSVEAQDRENHGALRKILDSVNSGTRALLAVTDQESLWDQVWIHYAKQRLPRSTLDSWEQHRSRHRMGSLPSLNEFKHFLDIKAKGRREFEHSESNPRVRYKEHRPNPYHKNERSANHGSDRRQEQRRNESYPKTSRFTPRETNNHPEPGRCAVPNCNERHGLYQCNAFRRLGLQERLRVVYNNQLCRCCMRQGHIAIKCERDGCSKCPESKVKHHFKLCPKTTWDSKPKQPGNEPKSTQ